MRQVCMASVLRLARALEHGRARRRQPLRREERGRVGLAVLVVRVEIRRGVRRGGAAPPAAAAAERRGCLHVRRGRRLGRRAGLKENMQAPLKVTRRF